MMENRSSHSLALLSITLSKFFERLGYYGIRSFLLLYMVNSSLVFSKEEASSLYGVFTMVAGLIPIAGGIFADLLIGVKIASILGLVLQLIGALILMIPSTFTFYSGLFCWALGTGFYNPSIISELSFVYSKKRKLMDAAMFLFYIGINTGAFLAPVLIGPLAESMGFTSGFIAAAIAFIISLMILMFSKKLLEDVPSNANVYQQEPGSVAMKLEWRIISILSLFVVIPTFWALFEIGNNSVYDKIYTTPALSTAGGFLTMVNPLVMVVLGIILALVWTFVQMSSLLKMGIGFLILTLTWIVLMATVGINNDDQLMGFFVFAFALQAVAELFISPVSLSYLCQYGPVKFNATLIGLHLAIARLATFIISFISVFTSKMSPNLVYITLIIISILLSILFIVFYFASKNNTAQTKVEL